MIFSDSPLEFEEYVKEEGNCRISKLSQFWVQSTPLLLNTLFAIDEISFFQWFVPNNSFFPMETKLENTESCHVIIDHNDYVNG